MGKCNIDHSIEDVKKKLQDQQDHLPENIYHQSKAFLEAKQDQQDLNELFHLLKKYDLSSKEEQNLRNKQLDDLLREQ